MIERKITIQNSSGLHTRPASLLAKTANRFQSEIKLYKDQIYADGKSIISLIALGAAQGSKLRLCAKGSDEEQAIKALSSLIENNFDEE